MSLLERSVNMTNEVIETSCYFRTSVPVMVSEDGVSVEVDKVLYHLFKRVYVFLLFLMLLLLLIGS